MAQARLDFLRVYGWFFGDFAFSRFRFTGGRLKAAKSLSRDFGVRGGERVEVFIPPYSFRSKVMVDDSSMRIYVPASFHSLVPEEFWAVVRRGDGGLIVSQFVGQTSLDLFDLERLRAMGLVPSCRSPKYGRGMGYCSVCASAYPLDEFRRCPFCGTILRSRPR